MLRVVLPMVMVLGTVHPLPLFSQTPPQAPLSGRAALEIVRFEARRAVELFDLRRRDGPLSRTDIYQGVWLREGGAPDSVVFDLLPFADAPRRGDGVALAFDPGLGARMWAGATDPDPLESALQGTTARLLLAAWRAVSHQADALPTSPHACPDPRVRFGSEVVHGFGTDGRDAPPETRAFIMYADCERALSGDWRVGAGLRGYVWRTPAMNDRQDLEAVLRLARVPPGNGMLAFFDLSWTPSYHRGILHLERPFDLERFHVRPFVRLARGEELPHGLGFWPGGFDGFPGLVSGERRGDREVTLALDASHPLAGPFSFRVLLAAGRTASGGGLLERSNWLAGARAGLNLATRYGVMRFEYGQATGGHHALFVRIGSLW